MSSDSFSEVPASSEYPDDPAGMSRKELQEALKAWRLPSGGTNVQLRERYSLCILGKSPEEIITATVTTSPHQAKKSPPKPSPKKSPPKPSPEKRLQRHRTHCPRATQQRIDRACTQRMYLVTKDAEPDMEALCCNFVVLGSTGNVYNVAIQRIPSCSCPDHARGNLCKHILFVLLKVMAVPSNSDLIYQAAWIGSELREMFEGMRIRFRQVSGAVLANQLVQESYARLKRGEEVIDVDDSAAGVARRPTEDQDCPICFEALGTNLSKTCYCRSRCGANFHTACIQHWLRSQRSEPTCPMCRGPWEDPDKKKTSCDDEGYTNLGRLQGQSPDRDTSTYHYEYRGYKRYRRW